MAPMDDDRVLIFDEDARERLKQFVTETTAKLDAEKLFLRKQGFTAHYQGEPISACPANLGGFPNIHWLEGFAGKAAPSRVFIVGSGFNMTPAEYVAAFTDEVYSIGLPADISTKLVAGIRSG